MSLFNVINVTIILLLLLFSSSPQQNSLLYLLFSYSSFAMAVLLGLGDSPLTQKKLQYIYYVANLVEKSNEDVRILLMLPNHMLHKNFDYCSMSFINVSYGVYNGK